MAAVSAIGSRRALRQMSMKDEYEQKIGICTRYKGKEIRPKKPDSLVENKDL